jgi:hypothetical protein
MTFASQNGFPGWSAMDWIAQGCDTEISVSQLKLFDSCQ